MQRRIIGDAWPHGQDQTLFIRVQIRVLLNLWPRSDEAHVPLDDVKELRQFVQLVAPENASESGYARIVLARRGSTHRLSVRMHRPKFQYPKPTPKNARTISAVEHWTRRVHFDTDGCDDHEGSKDAGQADAGNDIE